MSSKNNFKLGIWVASQRGRKDKLSDERFKRLELLKGWVWDASM